jgi:hypothetical protein
MSDVALKLLGLDCKPEHININNESALLLSCEHKMTAVVDIILNYPQIHNDELNMQALIYAQRYGMNNIVPKLIQQCFL